MKLRTVIGPSMTPLVLLVLASLTIAAPLTSAQAAAPTTYEEVLKVATEATASVKTWSADIETEMTMGGVEIKSSGETMGSGDRVASDLAMEVMGQLMQVKTVMGADGIHWTETTTMGQVQVFKLDMKAFGNSEEGSSPTAGEQGADQAAAQNPSKIFASLGKIYDIKLTGNEVMDGTDTYLLEGTIKDNFKVNASSNIANMGMAPSKVRVAVGTKDGLVRKLEQLNDADVAFTTMIFTNIKINPVIDDEVFQYTAPEGASVTDATDMIRQGSGGH